MFDEATLEKITMELLTNLGYETLNGYELERENYSNVILEDDLENAITKLNKNITNEDIKEVIRLIKNFLISSFSLALTSIFVIKYPLIAKKTSTPAQPILIKKRVTGSSIK